MSNVIGREEKWFVAIETLLVRQLRENFLITGNYIEANLTLLYLGCKKATDELTTAIRVFAFNNHSD